MNAITSHTFWLLLFTLLPLAGHAAPGPYWPGYPPSPYYYPPPPVNAPAPKPVTPADDMDSALISTENATHSKGEPSDNDDVEIEPSDDEVEAEKGALLSQEIAVAIQQGNFAEAYYLWRPLAEAGDAEAQYGIGWMYHNGYGLAIDDDEAIAWWELASQQGHVDATFALGMLYGLGEGALKRDMGQAVRYYRQAALGGHEDARLLLRTLMIEGDEDALQLLQTLLTEGRETELSVPAAVISSKANVRRGPGTQHKVLITLQQGHKLLPLKREGRWLLLGIADKTFTGWIHDSLIGGDILPPPKPRL